MQPSTSFLPRTSISMTMLPCSASRAIIRTSTRASLDGYNEEDSVSVEQSELLTEGRPIIHRCVVCLEEILRATPCGGADKHTVCADCLTQLGVDAAARPLARLTDEEWRTGRIAVQCPCSAQGCGGFFRPSDLDAALQSAAHNGDHEQSATLYAALVALAQAQQPLSAMEPLHDPFDSEAPVDGTTGLGHRHHRHQPQQVKSTSTRLRSARAAARLVAAPAVAAKDAVVAAVADVAARRRASVEAHRAQRQAAAEAALEAIRVQFRLVDGTYAAYMCGRCKFGPVDHFACGDLKAHNGERRGRSQTRNGCPRCGWFADSIQKWPLWDGKRVGRLASGSAVVRRRAVAFITTGQRQQPLAGTARVRSWLGEWQCSQCTLVNRRGVPRCAACDARRQ